MYVSQRMPISTNTQKNVSYVSNQSITSSATSLVLSLSPRCGVGRHASWAPLSSSWGGPKGLRCDRGGEEELCDITWTNGKCMNILLEDRGLRDIVHHVYLPCGDGFGALPLEPLVTPLDLNRTYS